MMGVWSMLRRRRRAVSNVLTAIMLVLLAIAAAGLGIAYMNKQATTLNQITSVDMTESRLYVNPITGVGDLTLVFTNTGTTTLTIRWGKIGLQGLACLFFSAEAQVMYGMNAATGSVTTSDPKSSGNTARGLALASQTSATVKFQNLAGFSTFTPPNAEYTVTIYTTGSETFSFKLAAETSGA
jgi:flagellin-like protein